MQLDLLDTPGGAIAILLLLSVMGVAMTGLQVTHGDYVLMTAFGALVALLRGHTTKPDLAAGGPPPADPAPAPAAAKPRAPIAINR